MRQSPEEVSRALEEILARPEFAPPPPSPVWDWISQALGAVWDFLRGLFPGFALGEGARGILFWLVIATLALAGLLLALRLVGYRPKGRWRRPARTRGGLPAAAEVAAPMTADGWETIARDLAARGRWREAALALYQAVLQRLAARGTIRLDAAKTPGDYRRESRRDAESHRRLDAFLRRFEPLAFGGRPADAEAFERLLEAAGARPANG